MVTVHPDPFSQVSMFSTLKFEATELAKCTSFFYELDGSLYLVSNWHCLSGRDVQTGYPISKHSGIPDRIALYTIKDGKTIVRKWCEFFLQKDEKALWFEHPSHGKNVDVGVLPVNLPDGFRAIPVNKLEFTEMALEVSHDLFILGYPLGLQDLHGLPIWKRATIASEPGLPTPAFFVDTATRSGMSGSPVIHRYRGFFKQDWNEPTLQPTDWFGEGSQFVGVYSGRLGQGEEKAQLGIVWKSAMIDEIISGGVFPEYPM